MFFAGPSVGRLTPAPARSAFFGGLYQMYQRYNATNAAALSINTTYPSALSH